MKVAESQISKIDTCNVRKNRIEDGNPIPKYHKIFLDWIVATTNYSMNDDLSSHEPRIIIAIDFDYFYAQCEEVRNPSIKGTPVVICVFSGRTAESGAVSTANYVARRLGVKSGIPIARAKKILQNNPESVFLPMDIDFYVEVSERIMGLIRPHGDKFEQASVDEAYLDVTNLAKADYQRAGAIGREINAEIFAEEGLTSSIGIALNKLMAKMAVDSRKPDGFTIILPDQVSPFLNPLPVGKLFGVGPRPRKK